MTAGIFELAVVMLLAAALGVVAKFLRQPVVLAYLATGALLAYLGWTKLIDQETFQVFSDLGIMFLLFLVGLEVNWDSLRIVGRSAVALGFGQVIFTFGLGYGIAWLFGFPAIHAAYIAFALTISSTVIVVKLLSEKRDLHSLSGRLAVGILIVQDIAAILLLIFLSGFTSSEGFSPSGLLISVLQGAALFTCIFWLGRKLVPLFIDRIASSQELLFLVSLAWVFLLAALVERIGFSIEIAGFIAGISLANASEHFQIAGRIRPLRDFFILIFFVLLGSSISVINLQSVGWPVIAFSLFVLIGNPLVVLVLMGFMGYRRRTSFLTGIAIAQISEFSLVLAAFGRKIQHLDDNAVSLITTVGIVTITISSYLIIHSDTLFKKLHGPLKFFERKMTKENGAALGERPRPVILIGAHRTGQAIATSVPRSDLLVVDFDPKVIGELKGSGYTYLFGDIMDPDIAERAHLTEARLVICTSPDFDDNMHLVKFLMHHMPRPKLIVRAEDELQAELLYAAGADYVLLANFTAGQYLGKTIALDPAMKILEHLKQRDLTMLKHKRRFMPPPPVPDVVGNSRPMEP